MLKYTNHAIPISVIIMANNKKKKRLYRIEDGSKIFGVCGGIAEYFDVDPTLVRVIWIIFSLVYGCGILAYLICALCMPKESEVR